MSKDIVKTLKKTRQSLEILKQKKARLEGEMSNLTKQLHQEAGVNTLTEAKALVLEMEKELDKQNKTLLEQVDILEDLDI